MERLPVIDLTPLRTSGDPTGVAEAVDAACRATGFFYVAGHGVPEQLIGDLDEAARAFFALPGNEKGRIRMALGGRAWRGWFPLGDELTAGVPDEKEGLYFGQDLGPEDPRVRRGLPLHGPNLYPEHPAALRTLVPAYIDAVTGVGALVLRAMALGLGLDEHWFERTLTADPLVLFRIFRYPPTSAADRWGVSEHTDYGLLTVLRQDPAGGLEVRAPDGWTSVPPIPGTFVVNLGDMLERMTGGRYRSTVHRVRNTSDAERLSFPLFLDPGWDVVVPMLPDLDAAHGRSDDRAAGRWDGADPLAWERPYGDYVLEKVARVFPDLHDAVLESEGGPDHG